jgi:carbamoyl-phosphate synthase large subunit
MHASDKPSGYSDETFNILFTSIGRRVELMSSFREALLTIGVKGKLIGTDIDPLAPAFQLVDNGFLVPTVDDSPEFIETIVKICRDQNVRLVLPLIDPDILVLAKCKTEIEATGARVAVADEREALICGDKWQTYEFLRDLGIPTPKSWLPATVNTDVDFPLFVRPRDGSAGIDAYVARNRKELDFFCEYVPHAIVQEFIAGPEITSDIICDFNGHVIAVVSRQRIAVRGGEAMKSVTMRDELIVEYCSRIAKALRAAGPITIQCMMKNNEPHFIEINGRLGGGVPLAIAAGVDIPALIIATAADMNVDRSAQDGYVTNLYMSRCDHSYFVTETELDDISSDYLRS